LSPLLGEASHSEKSVCDWGRADLNQVVVVAVQVQILVRKVRNKAAGTIGMFFSNFFLLVRYLMGCWVGLSRGLFFAWNLIQFFGVVQAIAC
jgi:hypothetical protein